MIIPSDKKEIMKSIVSIFETGRIEFDYKKVTFVNGDKGGLSYGIFQASLSSGSLYELINEYSKEPGSEYGGILSAYLKLLQDKSPKLNIDEGFKEMLKQAGYDPIMKKVQDRFFDKRYYEPSIQICGLNKFSLILSALVIFDSMVQGAYRIIKKRTNEKYGISDLIGEKSWISFYVKERHKWLKSKGGILAKTVYRMETIRELINEDNWELHLPLLIRGIKIT